MKPRMMIGWAVGSFTSAALVGAVSLLHLRFMTDSLGIGIGVAGMLVVISRVYDAVLDPIMGHVSDRTSTRWGRYRPYLLGGATVASISLVLLFNVPTGFSVTWAIVFSALVLLLYSTAYTMYRIPYLALGRAITQDFHNRSRLMTFSVCGSSLGTLAATSAAPLLLARLGSDRAAHGELAWLLAPLILLGGLATFLLIDREGGESAPAAAPSGHFTLAGAARAVAANRPFRSLIGFKVTMFAALALHGAAIPFYTRHVLHAADTSISSIFLAQTLLMMASQPFWVRMARQYGRRRGLMAATMVDAVLMLGWYVVPAAHPTPWIQILGGLEGVCMGGVMFGLYTVLTDVMDDTRDKAIAAGGDAGQEGMLAGVFVMVEKATAALGTFAFSAVMSYVGFVSASNVGAAQAPGVATGIAISISIAPALVAGLACLFLIERGEREPRGAGSHAGIAAAVLAVTLAAGTAFAPSRAEAAATASPPASPAPAVAMAAAAPPAGGFHLKRIVDRGDGKSVLEDYVLPRAPGADPAALVARFYATDAEIGTSPPGMFIDWHKVSTPRLLVILAGTMEVGTGDGKIHQLHAGDYALAMDTTGQGHTSRTVGKVPVTAMTVRLPKDDPLRSRDSSCSDGVSGTACVANGLSIQHNGH
jgi:Na+/melibiose symporter-like transporter